MSEVSDIEIRRHIGAQMPQMARTVGIWKSARDKYRRITHAYIWDIGK